MGCSLLEQSFTQALLVLLCRLLAVSVSFTCSAGSSTWSPNAKEIQSTGDPPASARKAIPNREKPTEWQAAQGCQTCSLWGCSALCYPSTSDLGVEIELPGPEFAVFQWLEPEFVFPIIFVVVLVFPLACFLTFLQLEGITHSWRILYI